MYRILFCFGLACRFNLATCGPIVGDGEGRASDGGSTSMSSEAIPSSAAAPAATGTEDLGLLCPTNFKVSEGAAGVCEEVAHFAAPPIVRELFRKTSLKDMFQSVEANAVNVARPPILLFLFFLFFTPSLLTQTLTLMRALDDDISRGFAEIQKQVDAEHARSGALSTERDALAERVKTLETRVVGLEEEHTVLRTMCGLCAASEECLRRRSRRSKSCRTPLCSQPRRRWKTKWCHGGPRRSASPEAPPRIEVGRHLGAPPVRGGGGVFRWPARMEIIA